MSNAVFQAKAFQFHVLIDSAGKFTFKSLPPQ